MKLLRPPTSAGPPGGAPPRPKSNVFGLTPRPLRTLCKVTAAQLAASRVPVPDADALLEAAGPLPGSGDENSVRIVESLDQGLAALAGPTQKVHHTAFAKGPVGSFGHPTDLTFQRLLSVASDRQEEALMLFVGDVSMAPVELLLMAADLSWAAKAALQETNQEQDGRSRGASRQQSRDAEAPLSPGASLASSRQATGDLRRSAPQPLSLDPAGDLGAALGGDATGAPGSKDSDEEAGGLAEHLEAGGGWQASDSREAPQLGAAAKAAIRKQAAVRAVQDVRGAYSRFLKLAQTSGAEIPLRAFSRLGEAMFELGDRDWAIDVFRQGCKTRPGAPSIWKGLGLCLIMAENLSGAESALDLANERDKSDALVWGSLALCNLKQMLREGTTHDHYRMSAVADCLKQALTLGLADVPILCAVAECYKQCDRLRECTKFLARAIELRDILEEAAMEQQRKDHLRAVQRGQRFDYFEPEITFVTGLIGTQLPSGEGMRNTFAEALAAQGLDLDALDVYQVVFSRCVERQARQLGSWIHLKAKKANSGESDSQGGQGEADGNGESESANGEAEEEKEEEKEEKEGGFKEEGEGEQGDVVQALEQGDVVQVTKAGSKLGRQGVVVDAEPNPKGQVKVLLSQVDPAGPPEHPRAYVPETELKLLASKWGPDPMTGVTGKGGDAVGPVKDPGAVVISSELLETNKELNRAAIGVKALLIKLGRNAELKQLQYTVKLINARLDEATEETRAAQEAEGS